MVLQSIDTLVRVVSHLGRCIIEVREQTACFSKHAQNAFGTHAAPPLLFLSAKGTAMLMLLSY